MKVSYDCIPCMIKQTIEAARLGVDDENLQREIINKTLQYLQTADLNLSPPELGKHIFRIIKDTVGTADLYLEQKQQFNKFILDNYHELKRAVYLNDDPVHLAAKLAISGNNLNYTQIMHLEDLLAEIKKDKFALDDYQQFLTDLIDVKNVLYLADNAGEIVFDKLFIEVLRRFYPERGHTFTVVVRGAPIINDATRADAELVDLDEVAAVIDNGDDAPATILHHVSREMRSYYDRAELIISKGQGNFESLNEEKKLIYFLFRVKCPVLSRELKVPEGSLVFKRSGFSRHHDVQCESPTLSQIKEKNDV